MDGQLLVSIGGQLFVSAEVPVTARNFIDAAAAAGNDIVRSPISSAEIIYPTENNRFPVSAYQVLK